MVRKNRVKRARVSKRNVLGNTRSRVANKKSRVANKKSRVGNRRQSRNGRQSRNRRTGVANRRQSRNRRSRVANRKIRGKNTRRLTGGAARRTRDYGPGTRRPQGPVSTNADYEVVPPVVPPQVPEKRARKTANSQPRMKNDAEAEAEEIPAGQAPPGSNQEQYVPLTFMENKDGRTPSLYAVAPGDAADAADKPRPQLVPVEGSVVMVGGVSDKDLKLYFLEKAKETLRAETVARAEANRQQKYLVEVMKSLEAHKEHLPELLDNLEKVASLKSVARPETEAHDSQETVAQLIKKAQASLQNVAPRNKDGASLLSSISVLDKATQSQKVIFQETMLKKNAINNLLNAQNELLKKNALLGKVVENLQKAFDMVNEIKNNESVRAEEAAKAEDAEKKKAERMLEEIKKKTFGKDMTEDQIRNLVNAPPSLPGPPPLDHGSYPLLFSLLTRDCSFDNRYDPNKDYTFEFGNQDDALYGAVDPSHPI